MTQDYSASRRQMLVDLLAGAGALALWPIADALASETEVANGGIRMPVGDVHDFDIFVGSWRTKQRRLKERLAGSTEWIEFDGTQEFRLLLGGAANMTDNVLNLPGEPYRGFTLRTFDAATKRWSIWWLDSRYPHKLDPPLVGRFEKGSGAFYADDTFKGKPIKIRYLWLDVTPTSRRWEQAFSPDGGKTWETNWISEFTKVG